MGEQANDPDSTDDPQGREGRPQADGPAGKKLPEVPPTGPTTIKKREDNLIAVARGQVESMQAASLPVEQIGTYRLLEVLGEGGMGTVYLAEQVQPVRRRVALKLVKLGMDTREVVARFESERQALALMNHPNVAAVYDAGATDQGRPYFVMEYVAGIPITEHCDRHKLPIDDRLDLFVQVCEAVQHAHQKGIIHRDLKPSNILVAFRDGKAVPKVIDFGVAKALFQRLTEKTIFTELGRLIGTPEYMSPEQAERTSQDIDTRSDIYSLGVLLYELLTGQLPFDPKSFRRAALEEIARILREVEPSKPSTKLSTLMTSGTDDSSLAARNRRLDVRALARKVRGDLDWVTMKCLEKDRSRRYASAAELAADLRRHIKNEPVLAGPPDAIYRLRKFVRRRRGAILKAAVAVSLIALAGTSTLFATREARSQRETMRLRAPNLLNEAKRLALRDPQTALRKLEQAVEADPDLAEAQLQRALLLKRVRRNDEAIAILERIVKDHPARGGEARVILAQLLRLSDPPRAEQYRREAKAALPHEHDYLYYQALALDEDQTKQAIDLLNQSLDAYPWSFDALWERAARYYQIKDYERMLTDAKLLVKVGRDLGMAWEINGVALQSLNRLEEALPCYIEAIARSPDYWLGYFDRATAYQRLGKYNEALQDSARTVLLAPEEAEAHWLHGRVLMTFARWDEARTALDRAIKLDPNLIDAYVDRGTLFRREQKYAEAIEDFSKVIGRSDNDALVLDLRGTTYLGLGRWEPARADFEKAIDLSPDYLIPRCNLGKLYLLTGDYRRAIDLHQQLVDREPNSPDGLFGRGIAFWFSGDTARAVQDFRKIASLDPATLGLVHLWVWEIEMQRGDRNAASAALAAADKAIRNPWNRQILAIFQTPQPNAQILEAAQGKDQQCDAFYYLGARALAQGQVEDAASRFQQCTSLGLVGYYEHVLAQCHLRALKNKN